MPGNIDDRTGCPDASIRQYVNSTTGLIGGNRLKFYIEGLGFKMKHRWIPDRSEDNPVNWRKSMVVEEQDRLYCLPHSREKQRGVAVIMHGSLA